MGVLHRAVPNHKFSQIFLKEWTIATNYRPEYSPHRTNFRSKFRVALTPSRNMSPKVRAVQNNTCLENSQKCRRSFVSVKNSSKSQEFRRISSTGVCITFAQYCMFYSVVSACVGRLWRSRQTTIDVILIQWHVSEWQGILQLLRQKMHTDNHCISSRVACCQAGHITNIKDCKCSCLLHEYF